MREPSLNLRDDLNEVVNVESSTRRTSNNSNAACPQAERLYDFPRDANFFLGFGSQRNANRIADAFVQKNAEPNRRFHGARKRGSGFRHPEVKGVINSFGKQAIGGDGAMNIRC